MVEEPPGDEGPSQQNPERPESDTLEKRRQGLIGELSSLLDEEHKLIAQVAGPLTEAGVNRLKQINSQEASLIDQLGAIEREIAAQ
jgi:hypothetical protein